MYENLYFTKHILAYTYWHIRWHTLKYMMTYTDKQILIHKTIDSDWLTKTTKQTHVRQKKRKGTKKKKRNKEKVQIQWQIHKYKQTRYHIYKDTYHANTHRHNMTQMLTLNTLWNIDHTSLQNMTHDDTKKQWH